MFGSSMAEEEFNGKCYDSHITHTHTHTCSQCWAFPLSPALLRHCCTLISPSQITVRYRSNKVFSGGGDDGQLTLFNIPKETSTRQKLKLFLFLVDLFCVDLFTSSAWAHELDNGWTAAKGQHCSHVTLLCLRVKSASRKQHFFSVLAGFILCQ